MSEDGGARTEFATIFTWLAGGVRCAWFSSGGAAFQSSAARF